MFLGAIVLAGEAKELEEKGTAVRIGRVVTQLGAEGVDRFVELAGLQEIAWCHGRTRRARGSRARRQIDASRTKRVKQRRPPPRRPAFGVARERRQGVRAKVRPSCWPSGPNRPSPASR